MKLFELRKFFVTFIFLLSAFYTKTYAQIVYHDIADRTLSSGSNPLYIDLDGDRANDIAIEITYNNQYVFLSVVRPTMGTNIGSSIVEVLSDNALIRRLPSNFYVDAQAGNYASGNLSTCTACIRNLQDWVGGASNAYIGFRFRKSSTGQMHYGWIKLSVNSIVTEFTILEVAYEKQAEVGLMTGFVPITSLIIEPENGNTTISIDNGQLRLIPYILPANAMMQTLTWTVDDASLARINDQGVLTALANGNVLVRAETQDGTNLWDTVRIYMSNQIVPVDAITVQGIRQIESVQTLNGTLQMEAIIAPSFATNQQVQWSVEDKNLATIDDNGLLTALNNGIVNVVATALDGSRISGFKAITISGQANYTNSLLIQGGHEITSPYGTLQMTVAISPSQNQNITPIHWSIDNPNIASISATGLLRAYADGSVTVTAKALDGSEVSANYTVQIRNQWKKIQNITVRGLDNINSISLDKGVLQMEAILSPSNASNPNVRWIIDNENIAKISPDGKLQALKNGIVNVQAIAQDGSHIIGQRNITITQQYEYIESINLRGENQATSITVPNGVLQMETSVLPSTASNQNIFWKVNDNNKAYINQNGLLTALSDGTVIVYAISQDGSGLYDSLAISISNQGAIIQRIELRTPNNISTINIPNGQIQITPEFIPSNVFNTQLIWTVDNEANAIVDQNGLLTALRNGAVTVRATSQDGSGVVAAKSFSITGQTVFMSNMSITSSANLINSPKDTLQLSLQYLPANATNTRPIWRSSAPHIATIDHNGILSAVSNGIVTISAIAQDGSTLSATKNFTITNQAIPIQSLEILSRGHSLQVPEDTMQMHLSILPNNATYTAIHWRIDDTTKASITPLGLLYAKANGVVTVEAFAKDNSEIIARKTITITNQKNYVRHIQLNARTAQLNTKGDTLQIHLQVQPTTATHQTFIWRSSDENIASVSHTGLVTANKNGSVTITAAAYDGSGTTGQYILNISQQHEFITNLNNATNSSIINTPNGILQMQVQHQPNSLPQPAIYWAVNDTSIATITPNGKLHAKKNGTVQVSALAMDGSQIQITIPIQITNQNIICRDLQLIAPINIINTPNGTLQYQAATLPTNTTLQQFAWRVNNPNIAKITQNGLLIPLGNGVVTVECKTLDGSNIIKSHTVTISQQFAITSAISLNTNANTNHISIPNGTLQMLAQTNGNPQLIQWSIDNTNIATIDEQGLVSAKGNGNATIMARALDGSNTVSTYSIVVSNQPISVQQISITTTSGIFAANIDGQALQLNAQVLPTNAQNTAIIWSVRGGTGWATIDNDGLLQPIHNGTVFVRATSVANPNIYKEEIVSIAYQSTNAPNIQSLNLSANNNSISLDKGVLQIFAHFSPLQARKDLIWEVSPNHLASINTDGLLQAIDNGIVTVSAYSLATPSIRASYTVQISGQVNPISSFGINGQNNIQSISTLSGTLQMQVTNILPNNAILPSIKWTVDNPQLAYINAQGVLTALDNGNVVVTAYALDGSGVRASRTIAISNQYIAVNRIQANIVTLNLTSSEQNFTLAPSILPSNATFRQLRYVSANPNLVTVNANGIVQALNNGSTQIFVYAEDYGQVMATINVSITRQNLLTTGMSINAASNTILEDKHTLQLNLSHNNTPSVSAVLWLCSDENIAKVSKDGLVTALKNGRVEITAYAQDKSDKIATYTVNISGQKTAITALQIQGNNTISQNAQIHTYTVSISPNNNIYSDIAWSVNDTALATITAQGVLIPKRNGIVTIFAKSQDASHIQSSMAVEIQQQSILVQSINSIQQNIHINTAYGSAFANVQLLPIQATNRHLNYFIQDTSIASVNAYGLVTAIKNGNTILTVYTADESNNKVNIPIEISGQYPLITAIQIQSNQGNITQPNGALQMLATATPQQAPWLIFAWTVTPSNLATITPSGLLLAKANGTVTITAKAQDGSNISQSTTVDILNQYTRVSSINLDAGNAMINTPNGTLAIQAIVAPSIASSTQVGWSISDASIARINNRGLVTALANGVVTVTARTLDGSNLTNNVQITISNQTVGAVTLSIAGANGINTIATPYGRLRMLPSFNPSIVASNAIYWTSSDTNIATINHEGWIMARRNGSVIIRAMTLDGNFIQASRTITITGQPELVHRIQLQDPSNTLQMNTVYDVKNLDLQVLNASASNRQVRWYTDSPEKVSISTSGQLRAWQNGIVKIFAMAIDGSAVQDSLIFQISNQNTYAQSLQIQTTTGHNIINIDEGTLQMQAISIPLVYTNMHLHWTVDNEQLATISSNGLLKAKRNGVVNVKVMTQDASGVYDEMLIYISNQTMTSNILVEAIDIVAPNGIYQITSPSQSVQFYANIFPQQALNQQLKWSVSNNYYGIISNDGIFTAHRDGTVYIFASSQDGSNVSGIYALELSNQPNRPISIVHTPSIIQHIQTYPNPFIDYIDVDLFLERGTALNVYISDVQGRVLQQWHWNIASGQHSERLYFNEGNNAGIYILYLQEQSGAIHAYPLIKASE